MKKLLLITTALIALGSAAQAADLAARPYTKAPPMMAAAIYDWSGFYIGVNGGGGWNSSDWNNPAFGSEGSHDSSGGTVGGQIGYRWQTGPVVFGLEAQGNWADLSGSRASNVFLNQTNRTKTDAFGLFTGQIGYSFNNVLLYAKGGAAVVDNKFDIRSTSTGANLASTSDTRWGATVGAGIEYGFAPNWSLGFEYDHIFLDRKTYTFAGNFGGIQTDSIKQDMDLFTARLNYKFGGPILAKY
jgi:outer membrane immunogenic protein